MRIDAAFQSKNYLHPPQAISVPKHDRIPENAASAYVPPQNNYSTPAVIVDISPQGWEAYKRYSASEPPIAQAGPAQKNGIQNIIRVINESPETKAVPEVTECQTCKNRKYQDHSNDPSVSFQSPTHISPGQSGLVVASHEGEHVAHEQANAEREGRKVVSQTVTLSTSICPECGSTYISGGVTRSITKNEGNSPEIPESEKS
jgi:ribosomal protein L32